MEPIVAVAIVFFCIMNLFLFTIASSDDWNWRSVICILVIDLIFVLFVWVGYLSPFGLEWTEVCYLT